MPKISIRGLSKVFGDHPERAIPMLESGLSRQEIIDRTGLIVAVHDVTFDVEEGETFVVMGLSGSGKSTLIRCINRLLEPTSGEVLIDGEDIVQADESRLRELRRSKMSMVFQHFGLFPHRSVVENIEYGLKMQGVPREEQRERAMRVVESVGLSGWENHKPENLSGGMQQRVGLARALATDADILLMDEAFSALDPLIRREMQDDLLELQHTLGKTIIFITHDLNEALKIGDRTAIMRDGRMVQIGTAEEIVSNPSNDYVFEFTRDVDRSRVLTVATVARQPDTLVAGRDSVRTAAARMRTIDTDYMVYVDANRRPQGLVEEEEIGRALREGENDLAAIASTDYVEVSGEDRLIDVYEAASSGKRLVAVDTQGRLLGVAEQLDLIAALAGAGQQPGEQTAEQREAEAAAAVGAK